ncbi:hypothetical protein AAG906_018852 [Vitis piasezkii]
MDNPVIYFHAQNQVQINIQLSFLIAGTFKLTVDHGKTYLLRIINAALQEPLFFSIAKHKMTVVGTDARTYSVAPTASNFFDNTTTTAIVQYRGYYTPSSPPSLPHLPAYNDTNASVQVMASLRSLADAEHPCNVQLSMSTKLGQWDAVCRKYKQYKLPYPYS